MRKIPAHLDNPFDNICIDIAEVISPLFKAIDLTPNHITLLSTLTGVLAIKYFLDKRYAISSLLFIISFIFDCIDGHYARKYDMVTKFGDYFDHVKDTIVFGTFGILLTYRYYRMGKPWLIIPLYMMVAASAIQFGCQEEYYNLIVPNKDGETLERMKTTCPVQTVTKDKLEKVLCISRYFGCGTAVALGAIYIYAMRFLDT